MPEALTASSWLIVMLEGVLEMVCVGIAVTRNSGHLMYANAAARRYLGESGLLAPARSADRAGERLRLQGRLADRIRLAGAEPAIWSVPERDLLIDIMPLSHEQGKTGVLGRRGGALLVMQERGKAPLTEPQHLASLFGLTPAEARTCLALSRTGSIAHCAQQLNVSPATVRSQLQVAMHKTATTKQAELIALILSIPVVLPATMQGVQ
ncbi:MAG: hypothetical protein FIB06_07055 [Betaproteobacteria bacterium]|nr:hypothetical protein [Betaproteobacteria bacterium]